MPDMGSTEEEPAWFSLTDRSSICSGTLKSSGSPCPGTTICRSWRRPLALPDSTFVLPNRLAVDPLEGNDGTRDGAPT